MLLTAAHDAARMEASYATYLQRLSEQAAAAVFQRQGQQGQARVLVADGFARDDLRQVAHHPRLREL